MKNKPLNILVTNARNGYTVKWLNTGAEASLTNGDDGWILESKDKGKNVTLLPAGSIDWDEILERGLS